MAGEDVPPIVAVIATSDTPSGLDEIQIELADGETQIHHGPSSPGGPIRVAGFVGGRR
jgi:hypothetical protein